MSYQHRLAIIPYHSKAREAITDLEAHLNRPNGSFEIKPLSPNDPFQVIHDRVHRSELTSIKTCLNKPGVLSISIVFLSNYSNFVLLDISNLF